MRRFHFAEHAVKTKDPLIMTPQPTAFQKFVQDSLKQWFYSSYLDRNFIDWKVVAELYEQLPEMKEFLKCFFKGQEYFKGWEYDYDAAFYDLMDDLELAVVCCADGFGELYQIVEK